MMVPVLALLDACWHDPLDDNLRYVLADALEDLDDSRSLLLRGQVTPPIDINTRSPVTSEDAKNLRACVTITAPNSFLFRGPVTIPGDTNALIVSSGKFAGSVRFSIGNQGKLGAVIYSVDLISGAAVVWDHLYNSGSLTLTDSMVLSLVGEGSVEFSLSLVAINVYSYPFILRGRLLSPTVAWRNLLLDSFGDFLTGHEFCGN